MWFLKSNNYTSDDRGGEYLWNKLFVIILDNYVEIYFSFNFGITFFSPSVMEKSYGSQIMSTMWFNAVKQQNRKRAKGVNLLSNNCLKNVLP